MPQRVKAIATEPTDPSSLPEAHSKWKDRTGSHKLFSDFQTHTAAHAPVCVHMRAHTQYINVIKMVKATFLLW